MTESGVNTCKPLRAILSPLHRSLSLLCLQELAFHRSPPPHGSSWFLPEITSGGDSVSHYLPLPLFFSSQGSNTHFVSFPFFQTLGFSAAFVWASLFLQEGGTCLFNGNCDAGLHCQTCIANGNIRPRCTRIQPISPISKVCVENEKL